MRIIRLEAENFKKLNAVDITPAANINEVSGKNAQGKTSILDAIQAAFDKKGIKTQEPIKKGKDKASIKITTEEFVITRKFTKSGDTLTVESLNGLSKYSSPQKLLDGFVGQISFDPLQFTTLEPKKQVEALLKLVDLPINPGELDLQKKELYDLRTIINRELNTLSAQVKAYEPNLPDNEIKAEDIVLQITLAQEAELAKIKKQNEIDQKKKEYAETMEDTTKANTEIELLEVKIQLERERIKANETKIAKIVEEGKALKAELALITVPDVSELKLKFSEMELTNQKIRVKNNTLETMKKVEEKRKESEKLTAQMEEIELKKISSLNSAKFPVPGLSFDESGVTYNGILFNQCSSAEQLKVSLGIAMAMNPTLRVIRITDGSLLDSGNMKIITDMAKEKDFQVWIERVDETGKVGFVIEEGEVKANNYEVQSDNLFIQ